MNLEEKVQKNPFNTKIIGSSWGPIEELENSTIIRYWLNQDKTSWIDAFYLEQNMIPNKEEFQKLWNLHPNTKAKIKIMGKEIEIPRFQQTYGRSYKFSGVDHKALPIPDIIQPWLNLANQQYEAGYNQALINWYEPEHYIGLHSDDEGQLLKNNKGELTVYSISLQPIGQPRIFRLKPKGGGKDRLDIVAENGLVLVMGGLCQKTHKHCVPKLSKTKQALSNQRINLTFRCFA